MNYLERYITREDFDNLDVLNFNNKMIKISLEQEGDYTEKVYIGHIDKYSMNICGRYIIKPKQKYGFIKKKSLLQSDYINIRPRKSKIYKIKIFLPETFINKQCGTLGYSIAGFRPDFNQRELLLDYNNKLEANYKKGLRR